VSELLSKEKVALVIINRKRQNIDLEASIKEMKELVEAAGGQIIAVITQSREKIDKATCIGKGKLEELKHLVDELEPDLVVFNTELSPVQLRNLDDDIDVRIIDRTMLILDIFARRARSREGILQVQLASLEYRLPRLTGMGKKLSRTGGGIGTRGAGEQKLEMDRRVIRRRIKDIKKQLDKVEKTRNLHRKQRQRGGLPLVSLLGYTNAGKSSLFNALCKIGHSSGSEQVEANNRLFQTLDTTIRKIRLGPGEEILISDTVGFIQDLPPNLVAAFRSTLEEVLEADLLLHVVDISDPDYLDKIDIVDGVLEDLGADRERVLRVFNKIDLIKKDTYGPEKHYVSARYGTGIRELLTTIRSKVLINRKMDSFFTDC
jgi:GTP-binding protein HflX